MKRCTHCILPGNYPGIAFNEEGLCNYCSEHKERKYLGSEALKKDIEEFLKSKKDRNKDYDCVLGFSGGRDSSYLLYYLTKVLNFKVIAYSADHGFIPEYPEVIMKRATDKLNVKLVIEEHDLLKKCVRHTISSWMRKPSISMIETLCTGCRLGVNKETIDYAKKNNIPVVLWGITPFEWPDYKYKLMKGGKSSYPLGYLTHIIRNPKWITSLTYLNTQYREYRYLFHEQKITKKLGILKIRPFYTHMRWVEKDVISTINKELDWEKNPDTGSTWRGDCALAFLKLYMYKEIYGFNDKTECFSHLIRDNQLSRKEALERLSKEEEIPEEAIEDFFKKIGLNYSDFEIALGKVRENIQETKSH